MPRIPSNLRDRAISMLGAGMSTEHVARHVDRTRCKACRQNTLQGMSTEHVARHVDRTRCKACRQNTLQGMSTEHVARHVDRTRCKACRQNTLQGMLGVVVEQYEIFALDFERQEAPTTYHVVDVRVLQRVVKTAIS